MRLKYQNVVLFDKHGLFVYDFLEVFDLLIPGKRNSQIPKSEVKK